MKTLVFLLLAFLSATLAAGQQNQNCDSLTFTVVQKMPQVKNDPEALRKVVTGSVALSEKEQRLSGTSFIGFVVSCEGKISDFAIIRDGFSGTTITARTMRTLQALLVGVPGEQNGKKVKVRYVAFIKLDHGSFSLGLPFATK